MRLLPVFLICLLFLSPATPTMAQGGSAEITFWESVRESKDPAELEAYLDAYPDGKFIPLAQIRLEALKAAEAAPERRQTTGPSDLPATDVNGTPVEPLPALPEKVVTVTLGAWPDDPERGFMGVGVNDVFEGLITTYGTAISKGTLVDSVLEGEAAHKAGIVPGSVILSIEGASTPDPQTLVGLLAKRDSFAPGDRISIRLVELVNTPSDYLQTLHRIAEQGDVRAMSNLALRYGAGRGVPQDNSRAAEWYRNAADMGDAAAMFQLGLIYSIGKGVPEDDAQSVEWYEKAANLGHVVAMTYLASKYDRGDSVPKDRAQAVEWYRKAAEAGDAGAMYQLGSHYKRGRGVARDRVQAAEWYRKGSEAGNEAAMNALGDMYFEGSGVSKDYGEAVRWYRLAMENGNSEARRNLARHYNKGLGVEKNSNLAAKYFFEAYAFADVFERLTLQLGLKAFSDDLSSETRRAIQRRLKDAGHYTGAIDGAFGPATLQAIKTLLENSTPPEERPATLKVAPAPPSGSTESGVSTSGALGELPEADGLGTLD